MDDETNGIDVARSLLPSGGKDSDLFALKVQGDSMKDAMISDGDVVILISNGEAKDGDMVAVWLRSGGSWTAVRFRHVPSKSVGGYVSSPSK